MRQSIKIGTRWMLSAILLLAGFYFFGNVQESETFFAEKENPLCEISELKELQEERIFYKESTLPSQYNAPAQERVSYPRVTYCTKNLHKKNNQTHWSKKKYTIQSIKRGIAINNVIKSQKKKRGYYIYQLEKIII